MVAGWVGTVEATWRPNVGGVGRRRQDVEEPTRVLHRALPTSLFIQSNDDQAELRLAARARANRVVVEMTVQSSQSPTGPTVGFGFELTTG